MTGNDRTRVQFTRQELEAMRALICNELRARPGPPRVIAETLAGILMKVGRASNRINPQEKDK